MIENLLTVGSQVLILFILIGIGFICSKVKLLNEAAIDGITKFTLYIVTPCAIIESFQREFEIELMKNLGISFIAALLTHIASIILASLFIKDKNDSKQRVLRFAAIFANTGYMAFPLQKALVGNIGIFYGAAYVAIFNILAWSYGVYIMSGDKKSMSPLKIIKTPGVIGVLLGVIIFILSIDIPNIISAPISYLAALNTPLPMIIIGFYLSNSHLMRILKIPSVYISIFLRLIVTPLLLLGGMYLFGFSGDLLVACTIAAAAPVAAITSMFASTYKKDTELASGIVTLSTLACIATMPIIIGIAI